MNLQVEKTLYDVLDVSANASFDDVERAFERIKIYNSEKFDYKLRSIEL